MTNADAWKISRIQENTINFTIKEYSDMLAADMSDATAKGQGNHISTIIDVDNGADTYVYQSFCLLALVNYIKNLSTHTGYSQKEGSWINIV